jgi:hypothetical protein
VRLARVHARATDFISPGGPTADHRPAGPPGHGLIPAWTQRARPGATRARYLFIVINGAVKGASPSTASAQAQ